MNTKTNQTETDMNKKQMNKTIKHYEQALRDEKITAKEFDGFIAALARIMAGA